MAIYNLNIIDCPKGSCGNNFEDNNYYLFKCPVFIVEHDIMFTKLFFFGINITLNWLLFGDLSISSNVNISAALAVHDFVSSSNRFTF